MARERPLAFVLGLSAVALMVVTMSYWTVDSASAQEETFTDASLRGSYGFSAHGMIIGIGPAVAAGIIFFTGTGQCTIVDTINIGGTSFGRTSSTCAYTVNPNGMGTLVATFPGDPGPTPLSFVIVDNKKEIRFIRTDIGVAEGVAKRQ